jgi:16S rRNA (guanine527-N7)-methyltransferase
MALREMDSAWRVRLDRGLEEMGLSPAPEDREGLLQYIALLAKWNRAFNLTAVTQPLEMIDRHLLDSLSVLPYVTGERVLDVGTGAGLPGIPLAILLPGTEFVLLDSNGKKVRFVRQAVMELGLGNVQPRHARVEALTDEKGFDQIISRAFASLEKMVDLCSGLMESDTELLAMKGSLQDDEMVKLESKYQLQVSELKPPAGLGERNLIRLKRK